MTVDPTSWFFKAHFHEDPVVPGSLGLESFWQLVKVYAAQADPRGGNGDDRAPIFFTGRVERDENDGMFSEGLHSDVAEIVRWPVANCKHAA